MPFKFRSTILFCFVVCLFTYIPTLRAQNEKLTATASETTVANGDQFQITYSLNVGYNLNYFIYKNWGRAITAKRRGRA